MIISAGYPPPPPTPPPPSSPLFPPSRCSANHLPLSWRLDLRPEYFDKNLSSFQKKIASESPHLGGFERCLILILQILCLCLLMVCRAALNSAIMTFRNCLTKECKKRRADPRRVAYRKLSVCRQGFCAYISCCAY